MYTGEDFSDWEYYSDSYYDGSGSDSERVSGSTNPKQGKEPINNQPKSVNGKRKAEQPTKTRRSKRRRTSDVESVPELSLGGSPQSEFDARLASSEPLIKWRCKEDEGPVVELGEGKGRKVSFMADWRERLSMPLRGASGGEDQFSGKEKRPPDIARSKRKREEENLPASEAQTRTLRRRRKD